MRLLLPAMLLLRSPPALARCVAAFAVLPAQVDPSRIDPRRATEEGLALQASSALPWYYGVLVANRCVEAE